MPLNAVKIVEMSILASLSYHIISYHINAQEEGTSVKARSHKISCNNNQNKPNHK